MFEDETISSPEQPLDCGTGLFQNAIFKFSNFLSCWIVLTEGHLSTFEGTSFIRQAELHCLTMNV
jgi:hypothetical protein